MCEQERGEVAVAVERRPVQRRAARIVSGVCLRTVPEEDRRDLPLPEDHRARQWRHPRRGDCVDIGAAPDEQIDHHRVLADDRAVQRCPTPTLGVDLRAAGEQGIDERGVAVRRRQMERDRPAPHGKGVLRADVGASPVFGRHRCGRQHPILYQEERHRARVARADCEEESDSAGEVVVPGCVGGRAVAEQVQHPDSQPCARIVEAFLHGRDGNVEEGGDVALRIAAEIIERHDDALMFSEERDFRPYPPLHGAPLRDGRRFAVWARDSHRVIERREREALGPREPIAMLEDDPAEPARECRRIAERGQVGPRLEESLLGDIFGEVRVVDRCVGGGDRHALEATHQRVKGVAIANRLPDSRCTV